MRERRIVAFLAVAGLLLSACAEAKSAVDGSGLPPPARVETVEGSDVARVVLTSEAARRLELETAQVGTDAASGRTVIPHAAIFYGLTGETWTYTNPEELTYVREPITVERIDGERAFLAEGPTAGTWVVTVGAPELYGVETGIGD